MKHIQRMGIDALNWYEVVQNRLRWYERCQTILSGRVPGVPGSFVCGCGRTFGRTSDLTGHKKYCNDTKTI